MKELMIRNATLDDLETLLVFEQELIRAELPMDATIRRGPVTYYDLKRFIEDKEVALLVAETDKIVACGYAMAKQARPYLDHKKYAYLGFMYTRPEYRGRGINQKIVATLKEWAVSKGLTEMRLTVYQTNDAAIKAYEKAGFEKHIIEMRLRASES